MNHVTLQLKDGTTQVDHILVSRFGVFVIETKDYKGWIFANPKQAKWTQVLFKAQFKFQNPILQNFRHVRAVQDLLDFLPPSAIQSVVVFTGEAEFKTEVPQGVFDLPRFIDYLREQTVEVMSLNRLQFCVGRIETSRLAISGKTDVEHVQSLAQRHENSV
ncbi:MAG: nuclease-related domain-containing protein [Rhodoferax sp.]|nr:nuclease-related domain-containing protein [Rhodoferax sp.]